MTTPDRFRIKSYLNIFTKSNRKRDKYALIILKVDLIID